MPKKPKIDKRLDKLFKDIQPEDNVSIAKRSPKVEKEAATQVDPNPVQQKSERAVSPRPIKKHTSALIPREALLHSVITLDQVIL